ncbi:Transposase DDE domain protein [Posidoniimonas polymericola]|uniref:Transposase DDE domain protein n=1 Tax=Posidoniimonas polymericola TaxID=2528002 RepID=A0A5C5XR96_9BACT|nr:IS4 family transposase [Posidoniimonas polymericola]TWT65159.1 Transposase DDE domain protein [Posidoniimonas polymericola]
MPHQDQAGLANALDWLAAPTMFGRYTFRSDCVWTPWSLVRVTLLWAWGEESTLTDRYAAAGEITRRLPDGQRELVSYQAFLKLLARHSGALLFALLSMLQRRLQQDLAGCYRVSGMLAFGVDGTRVELPRTAANQQAFASPTCRTRKRGRRRRAAYKKAANPQAWLTTLWHVGSGLPWMWRHGPSGSSEREHLLEMLASLPEPALLTADAGFVGYDFWRRLQEAGHDFLIRVGANVTLIKQLGYFREQEGRVYLWPDKSARKRQPPIVLRLVIAQGGKRPVYLVTSVLTKSRLTDKQVIELYRARWGVEVFYRSFKQTFARRKLRSGSPVNAGVELDWSLAALTAACLYAKKLQVDHGESPQRTSVAGVLRVLRQAMRGVAIELPARLAHALIDAYQRQNKASRDYPKKKPKYSGATPPKILKATKLQVQTANQLRGLTA